MPALDNARHERFAQELAKGKTADEAYQLAGYAENRGNAARLKANESVAGRVAEIQERAATRTEISVAALTANLLRIAVKAEQLSEAPGLSAHYAEKCLKIRTKSGKIEPLALNRAQRYVHERLEAQRAETGKVRALLLKARQQGFSTYIGGRFYSPRHPPQGRLGVHPDPRAGRDRQPVRDGRIATTSTTIRW
jgi:phage terminase small subunit